MAHLLELAQLPQADDVSQVDVGAAGIEALLQAQPLSGLQQPDHLLLDDNLRHPPLEERIRNPGRHRTTSLSIDRAFSTSWLIWALSSSGDEKRFSPRRRSTSSTLSTSP